MNFLDVFNKIKKGDYALTDEAVYASLQNHDELIPLYGGNKEHHTTERKISITAKTQRGVNITIFSGEGIIISLDGSAGCMTYKIDEKFALNHHAGFITLRKNAINKVNLEYFAKFMQNFYKNISVSDGSKTLSLTQIYAEEFSLPSYDTQCEILKSLKAIEEKMFSLQKIKYKYIELLDKEIITDYTKYQGVNIPVSECIDYMSGNSGLTGEFIYKNSQNTGLRYTVLSSATEKNTMMGEIPLCLLNNRYIKVFENKEGLLVTRNGNAGQTQFLQKGRYTINDHAYILFVKDNIPYDIDLYWFSIQYKEAFIQYSSNSDNGTWNKTGFFEHTFINIPCIEEQLNLVTLYKKLNANLNSISKIEEMYSKLLNKVVWY